ncbi:MAG TPA: hypothetical protein DEG69_11085, partial [Flavobacteriaceae bacterium]|nr:hypothetical protein [Flavobacteriaceae bacterium]
NEFISRVKFNLGQTSDKFVGIDIACPGADIIAEAHKLPFEDKQFDLLVSFDCMEHIPEDEIELCFKEFSRVAERMYIKISV